MEDFVKLLEIEFEKNKNQSVGVEQKVYLRNQFECYGLKSQIRREIQKPFLVKEYLPNNQELHAIVNELWNKPQREFQYFSQELVDKSTKRFEQQDIALLEYMVTHKSWWDTVDFIASKLIGRYFKIYPEKRQDYIDKWLSSENIWSQRSALLFQLKYKNDTDTGILSYVINSLLGSKEFFINKAIGWVLREYSKSNQMWVEDFVNKTSLSPLSKREALRLIR